MPHPLNNVGGSLPFSEGWVWSWSRPYLWRWVWADVAHTPVSLGTVDVFMHVSTESMGVRCYGFWRAVPCFIVRGVALSIPISLETMVVSISISTQNMDVNSVLHPWWYNDDQWLLSCHMVPYHTSSHLTMRHVLLHLLDCGVWSRQPHIFGESGVSIRIYNRTWREWVSCDIPYKICSCDVAWSIAQVECTRIPEPNLEFIDCHSHF